MMRWSTRAMTSLAPPGPDIATSSTARSGFQSAACAPLIRIATASDTEKPRTSRLFTNISIIDALLRLHARVFNDLRVFHELRLDELSEVFGRTRRGIRPLRDEPVAEF